MTKVKGVEPERKTDIVYRQTTQDTKEKVYSFTITPQQAEFIKAHKKETNFSETLRKHLDSVMETVNKSPDKH